MNLERTFRCSSQQACTDAIGGLIVIFAIWAAVLLTIAAAFLAPTILQPPGDRFNVVLGIIVVTFWLMIRRYRRYASTPEIADRFRSKPSRLITALLVFVVPGLGVALVIAVAHHLPL